MDEERLTEIERRAVAEAGLARARGDAATWALEDVLTEDVPALVAEVRRLQAVELEALRVLGAIVVQHVQQRIDVPEEALLREYTVSRAADPATLTVRFRAEPVDER